MIACLPIYKNEFNFVIYFQGCLVWGRTCTKRSELKKKEKKKKKSPETESVLAPQSVTVTCTYLKLDTFHVIESTMQAANTVQTTVMNEQ